MPTIDVQSFSEQQKQKDLMKESNKALEATKEVKPEQEEPKQVQEPVVKEEVVKEEPVKELPSMDNKEEAKQDVVVDVEDAMNITPMQDFTDDDDSGKSLLERLYGITEDRLLQADMQAVERWNNAHKNLLGKTYDVAKNVVSGVAEGIAQTSKLPFQLAVWYGTAGVKSDIPLGETMVRWANDSLNNIDYFIKETSPFDADRDSLSYGVGNVLFDIASGLGISKAAGTVGSFALGKESERIKSAFTKFKGFKSKPNGNLVPTTDFTFPPSSGTKMIQRRVLFSDLAKQTPVGKRVLRAINDAPMHYVMSKDVAGMMEERIKQYRDETGQVDMIKWIQDAGTNLTAVTSYGAFAWMTEAAIGLGWIMKNSGSPTTKLTFEALQALRGGKDFVSKIATNNARWTYALLSAAKEGATEALQEIEQIGTEWAFSLKTRNPEDGSLEYRAKDWKTECARILTSSVLGGVMGGGMAVAHVALQKKEFANKLVPVLMEVNPKMTEQEAIKRAKSLFEENYVKMAPKLAKEQEVKMSFASGNGVEYQKFVDFIGTVYKNSGIPASNNDIITQADMYSDNLYNLCNGLGIPMYDWAKHITATPFKTKEGNIGLQFRYDGKPLTEYMDEQEVHKEMQITDRSDISKEDITKDEYAKWEERNVNDLSKETKASLKEAGITQEKVWTKRGEPVTVDNIAPVNLSNKLDSFKLGEKINIEKLKEISLPKDVNGAYDSTLSAILINPSKANHTTLSHEFGHFFFETMYSAYRNNLLSDKIKGDFTGLLTALKINPATQPHLTTRQSEVLADIFSAYSTGSALKGKVSKVLKANNLDKAVEGVYKPFKEDAYKAWKLANRPDVVISPATVDFMRNILGTDMGEIKAKVSDKSDIPEGMTKEDYAKDVVSERNPEVVYNSDGKDISFAHPIAMENPNSARSKVYTRTLESLNMAGNPDIDLTYQRVNNAEQAAKAAEMVSKDPEAVKSMIINNEVHEGTLKTALMAAYQHYMQEKGNYGEAVKMLQMRSLEQTVRGQELQFERMAQLGDNDISNPELWQKAAIVAKMEACIERIGLTKFKSTADLAKWRENLVRTLSKQISDGKITIKEAISKINEDCKGDLLYQIDWEAVGKKWRESSAKVRYDKVYEWVRDKVNEALNIELTESEAKVLSEKANKLRNEANSFDGKILTIEQAKAIKDLQDTIKAMNPSSNLKIFMSTLSRINLLSNIGTLATNVVSNAASVIPEMITRRLLGTRLSGYVSHSQKKAKYDYAMDIFKVSDLTVATMRPDDVGKEIAYKGEKTVSSQGEGNIRKFSRFMEKITFKLGLGYPDAVTKSIAFNDSADIQISNYVDSQLPDGSLSEKKAMAEKLFDEVWQIKPDSEIATSIREKAILDAEIATYTNKGLLNDTLSGIRRTVNSASGDLMLGDIIAPFVATPANVIQQGLTYSAGGLYGLYHIKTILNDLHTGKLSDVSRNAISYAARNFVGGILVVLLGAMIDDDEYIPPYESCSMAERELVKAKNGVFNSLKFGDTYISLDYFGVLGVPLAGILNAKRKGYIGYTTAIASQVAQLPIVSPFAEIQKQAEEYQKDPERGIGVLFEKVADGVIARSYPAFFNTVASTFDSYVRETKGISFLEKTFGRIYPGVLERKQSFVTGGDIEKTFADRTIKFFLGGRVKISLSSATIEALESLNLAGELPYIGDFTNRGRFKDYTDEQKQKARETFARLFKKEADKLVKSSSYIRASAEDQKTMISKLRSRIVKGL